MGFSSWVQFGVSGLIKGSPCGDHLLRASQPGPGVPRRSLRSFSPSYALILRKSFTPLSFPSPLYFCCFFVLRQPVAMFWLLLFPSSSLFFTFIRGKSFAPLSIPSAILAFFQFVQHKPGATFWLLHFFSFPRSLVVLCGKSSAPLSIPSTLRTFSSFVVR